MVPDSPVCGVFVAFCSGRILRGTHAPSHHLAPYFISYFVPRRPRERLPARPHLVPAVPRERAPPPTPGGTRRGGRAAPGRADQRPTRNRRRCRPDVRTAAHPRVAAAVAGSPR